MGIAGGVIATLIVASVLIFLGVRRLMLWLVGG